MKVTRTHIVVKLGILFALIAGGVGSASAQITLNPTSIAFGKVSVNVVGYTSTVKLTNNYSYDVTLTGITFGLPNYTIYTGNPIQTIKAHTTVQGFGFIFLASTAGTYDTNITFNFDTVSSVNLTVTATASTTTATATLSTTSINFGSVNLGSSVHQTVTISNSSATDSINVQSVSIYYQPFAASPITLPYTISAGKSLKLTLTFSPMVTGNVTGNLTFCYNRLPCNAVDLSGSGTSPTSVALTSYPTLPYAVQGYTYSATLTAAGGKSPYKYRMTTGTLPSGLTLASSGAISGTVSSTATTGNYMFKAQVEDSSIPPIKASQTATIVVNAATGANCAITSEDIPNSTSPIVDLMDLGTGTYCPSMDNCNTALCQPGNTCQGGLYPGGSNTDPNPHDSDGVTIAQGIQAIDGKVVMISMGESASQQPFEEFITEATADPEKNSDLVIVDGAEGSATANNWANQNSSFWQDLLQYSLPWAGVTADQVQVAWMSDVDSESGSTACVNQSSLLCFPGDAQNLQSDYEKAAANLLYWFPNIKMMFFSSINYTGYSTNVVSTLPEPQGYESAFGAKWAIQDQISGVCCNYNPNNGPVTAPWMGWSSYFWGNGLIPRSDGVTWACTDLNNDGLHPANPWGHYKIAGYLLNFFKTSGLATPWFVQP